MRTKLRKTLALILAMTFLFCGMSFAAGKTPDEKANIYYLWAGGGTPLSEAKVTNIMGNLNRYSPLAMSTDTSTGTYSLYVTNNTTDLIEVTWEPATLLHRIMPQNSYSPFNTLVTDFDNNVLRLRVASGRNFKIINKDENGIRKAKIGLAHTRNSAASHYPTEAQLVPLADYVDLDALASSELTFFDVEIPVKDIKNSTDVEMFNSSTSTALDWSEVNCVIMTLDVTGAKSSMKIMYFCDIYFAYAPKAPENLSATALAHSVDLSWDYENTSGVTFNIFRDGEYIANVSETTYTDKGLLPDTEYNYQVQAEKGDTTSASDSLNVMTDTFFTDPSERIAAFSDVFVNSISYGLTYETPYDGENTVEGKLHSDKYTGGAVVIGAAYKDNALVDTDIDILDSVTPSGTDFSLKVTATDPDEIKFFAVDSLENMALISQIGVLNSNGFAEYIIPESEKKPDDFSVEFVSNDSSFDVSCKLPGFAVLAVGEDTALSDLTEANASDKIAGVDVSCSEDELLLNLLFDDTRFSDGNYLFKVSGLEPKKAYYATAATISGYFTDLNDPAVTQADIKECVESPVLNLDLEDYNRVPSDKALNEFSKQKPDNITTAAEIQETLDKSVGTVLFCTPVKKTAADVAKYSKYLGFNAQAVKEIEDGKNQDVNNYLLSILSEKGTDEISAAKAAELFDDSYLCAKASCPDTWKSLKNTISSLINLSEIPSGIDEADVFKEMMNSTYKTPSDISAKYSEVINKLAAQKAKEDAQKNKNNSSSGGGGGGGGKTYSIPASSLAAPENNNNNNNSNTQTPAYQNTIFADVSKSHWAYDSIINLLDLEILAKDVNFRPNDKVKREEYAKMLVMIFKPVADKNIAFEDVSESDWFYPYICAAFSGGISGGISETMFGSGKFITRQDMAKMLYNAIGSPELPVEEVEEETEEKEEETEKEKEEEKKVEEQPEKEVLPEEMDQLNEQEEVDKLADDETSSNVEEVSEAEDVKSEKTELKGSRIMFNDADEIADYAKAAVEYFFVKGILKGDENGNFNPKKNATRAECAVMLARFLAMRKELR